MNNEEFKKIMFKFNKIIFVIIFFLGFFGLARGAEGVNYYVDNSGSPACSNSYAGTEAQPWCAISKAASTIVAGDIAFIKSGTYDERVNITGSNASLKIFKSYSRRQAIVTQGFKVCSPYTRVEGFYITGSPSITDAAIEVGYNCNASYAEIIDNYIDQVRASGISVWSGSYSTISNNYVYLVNQGIMIQGDHHTVSGNEVNRIKAYPGGGDCDYMRLFGEAHTISDNYFHGTIASDVESCHFDSIQSYDIDCTTALKHYLKDIVIERNMFLDGGDALIFNMNLAGTSGYESCTKSSNVTIRNNVFIKQLPAGYSSYNITVKGISNVMVYNNTVGDSIYSGIACVDGGDITIKNNIFYHVADTPYFANTGCTLTAADKNLDFRTSGSFFQANYPNDIVNQDPLFVDYSNNKFMFQSGSPAKNAGTTILSFSTDYDGVTRPQGSAWDIGAYEYVESGGDTTPPTAPSGLTVN